MKKIPKSYAILGHDICVQTNDTLLSENEAWGRANFHTGIIELQTPFKSLNVSEAHKMSTFWHEYYHMALYHLGHTELALTEHLVDQLGNAMHQFHQTKQF